MAEKRGILGQKVGMTQIWDEQNRAVPVTVIQAGPCRVVQVKTPERDGYSAIQLAFGDVKPRRINKPETGHFKKANQAPAKHLAEMRVDDSSAFSIGQVIQADVFASGDIVDVTGISKGKGFTGHMKRHNFKGQGASHGNHKKHRAPGSIGACATPARVFKGMKGAGQMGNVRTTTLNLEVVEGDAERGLLLVKGAVPGPAGGLVFVRNAVKGERGLMAEVLSNVDLPEGIFGIQPNVPVMHQVVTAQLAAARAGTHSTKSRSEVSGGGAKPWRQKGTGRARQGSSRAPHWTGGGVAHGPKPRSYRQRTPKKMVWLALRSALSDRAASGMVTVVEDWGFAGPKTKDAVAALKSIGVADGERVLVVLTRDDDHALKSFRNLGGTVDWVYVEELNTYDVLVSDRVIFTSATLGALSARGGGNGE